MTHYLKIVGLLCAVLATAVAIDEGIVPRRIYVDASATCGFGCDGSLSNPFVTILSALRSIDESDHRVEILVISGVYSGSGNTGLTIDFAYHVLIRSIGPQESVIDCGGNAARAFFVFNTIFSLQGFTIKNCQHSANGGGMLIVDSHVILESVHFTNNSAQNGGALYVATLPSKFPFSLTLKSTSFQNNRAVNNGGALHISRVSVEATNTVLRCNRAGNLHQSYGSDLYCESSTSTFDFMSDTKSAGVACPTGSSNACEVTYQNLTSSGLLTQSLCGQVSVCEQFSDQSLAVMNTCGDGKCDEQFESCLSCPLDCQRCSFTGVKVELFSCLPSDARNTSKRSECFSAALSRPSPLIGSLPIVQRSWTGVMTGYFRVPETARYTFKLLSNVGARMKIDSRTVIDALFTNANIESLASQFLKKEVIHALEVEFFGTGEEVVKLQVLKKTEDSAFILFDDLFYSLNDCGDGILDPKEAVGQPLVCLDDVTNCQLHSCIQNNDYQTCGNGICDEEFKDDCFIDCYAQMTTLCPQLQQAPGLYTENIPVSNDTLGTLIKNQGLYRLPGMEHLMSGFDISTGEESILPLFYFGFCDNKIVKTVQDLWRGLIYTVPPELFAQPFPRCSFSLDSQRYSSSNKMASEMSKSTGISASAGGSYRAVTLGGAYSKENSVKKAKELESTKEGTLLVTEVQCLTSRVQITDYPFHPLFLSDLAAVEDVDTMVPLLYKYGTHFYDYVSLGGKLKQIKLTEKSYANSKTSSELSKSAQWSFSASVTLGAFAPSADYSQTNEVDTTSEEQEEFENSSVSSQIITVGGAPGSFGPQDEYTDVPTNFGDWAQTVDLLPVPVDYQLRRIATIIPKAWKTRDGTKFIDLWEDAEQIYYRQTGVTLDDIPTTRFEMTIHVPNLPVTAQHTALFIKIAFLRRQANNTMTPVFDFDVWDDQGAKLLTVDLHLGNTGNGRAEYTNTVTFDFDAPANLTSDATHIAVGFQQFSLYPNGGINLRLAHFQDSDVQHVMLHDTETGEQFYFPYLANGTVQLDPPYNTTIARPLQYKHNAIFIQYNITNLNNYPAISPFGSMEPYSAQITFVGTKTEHTVWQNLGLISTGVYYWPDKNKTRSVFEIYQAAPSADVLGDLVAIQIRMAARRSSVYQKIPGTKINASYKNLYGPGGYNVENDNQLQNPEVNHPNPKFKISDIWVTTTECDHAICESSKGISTVWTSRPGDVKVVQLLTTDEMVFRMVPLKL